MQVHIGAKRTATGKPPRGWQGPGSRMSKEREGCTVMVHVGRLRHAAQGADTSGGGWQVADVGDVHVEGGRRFSLGEEVGRGCNREGI